MKNGFLLDHYRIDKPFSRKGGTASVYLAHLDDDRSKVFAIKISKSVAESATNEGNLLQREAEFLSKWNWRHPSIVRIYPIPLKNRNPEYVVRSTQLSNMPWYIVMEYLQGGTLEENLAVIQKFPLMWKLELFYQILLPIAFLHEKGYAHRDLKPGNIVFRNPISPSNVAEPVLIDFALADNGNDENRIIVGQSHTLEYASPERILRSMGVDDAPVDNILSADIWSLGLILYEILTGDNLLKGSRENIRTTIIREQIAPTLPIPDERGEILAAFIRVMLNKKPEKRPSINQIIYALEEKVLLPFN